MCDWTRAVRSAIYRFLAKLRTSLALKCSDKNGWPLVGYISCVFCMWKLFINTPYIYSICPEIREHMHLINAAKFIEPFLMVPNRYNTPTNGLLFLNQRFQKLYIHTFDQEGFYCLFESRFAFDVCETVFVEGDLLHSFFFKYIWS